MHKGDEIQSIKEPKNCGSNRAHYGMFTFSNISLKKNDPKKQSKKYNPKKNNQ